MINFVGIIYVYDLKYVKGFFDIGLLKRTDVKAFLDIGLL